MNSNIDLQRNINQSKHTMHFLFITWPILVIVFAGWLLYSGRAQAYGKELAAWITITASILSICLELYCHFSMTGEYDIIGAGQNFSRSRFFLRLLEFALMALFEMPAFIVLLDSLIGFKPLVPSPYNWLGLILVIPGLLLNFWSTRTFYTRGQGTPFPFEPAQKLLDVGPYRYTRNPMSVSLQMLYYGLAVLLQSYMILFMITFSYVTSYYYIIQVEEKEMEIRHGQTFLDYKARVPRFFPRRPKKDIEMKK